MEWRREAQAGAGGRRFCPALAKYRSPQPAAKVKPRRSSKRRRDRFHSFRRNNSRSSLWIGWARWTAPQDPALQRETALQFWSAESAKLPAERFGPELLPKPNLLIPDCSLASRREMRLSS